MNTIIISTDMEGLTGICRWSQVTPTSSEYEQGCAALRRDLRLVVDELTVSDHRLVVVDGHWTGTNLKPGDVGPAYLSSGTRMPWGMVEGVQDDDVVGVLLLGYHGCAGSQGAMAHTWDTVFPEVRFNGTLCGEITLAAMLARQCGVPIIGVSGDDHACIEAKATCGAGTPTAEVKRSLSYESVQFHPDAETRLRAMARNALLAVGNVTPDKEQHCIMAKFLDHEAVDRAGLVPGSVRLDSHALEFAGTAKACFDALRVWAMLAEH